MHTSAAAVFPDPYGSVPLAGCVVAITADRRREELTTLLERRGARVVSAPTLRIQQFEDETPLFAATQACLSGPLDYVVATTGIGWRGWMSAAQGWGLEDALRTSCMLASVLTRGPKATGAVRATGLSESYASPSEESREILNWLTARQLRGTRIAVQRHASYDAVFIEALREHGAEVIDVPVYRWGPSPDPAAVDRLVHAIARREVHAVAFTSAPGASALFEAADALGEGARVRAAFTQPVLAACVGELCARPFLAERLPALWPQRGRLGSLVRILTDELPGRLRQTIPTALGDLVLQGNAVGIGGNVVILPAQPAAVLHELARSPGRVVARTDLLRRVWGRRGADHIVEVTVARLRAALGEHGGLVVTVPKRGYRIAAESGH
ncbi:uroporphyrinogen-III synthase [Actinospica sp.]|jgi:uroporphyrinogen-III synthase|uniref:uroporphyrinogen-III synthase n=1 Tax=Actinospica sp. TaxID=1872142 RepID=UPI002CD4AFA6|nr:uroporphyrinogen-III synthase [Actinospica sp.]HWG28889.1 uroporphyrinogen-III synthase [Actinospica sp.]